MPIITYEKSDNNYNDTVIKNSVRNTSIIFIRYYQLEKKTIYAFGIHILEIV